MLIKQRSWVYLATLITAGSGLINIFSVISFRHPERVAVVRDLFPLEFIHLSHFAVLFLGFTLVITSINIYKRKRRAFLLAIVLSILSIGFLLVKGLNLVEASFSGPPYLYREKQPSESAAGHLTIGYCSAVGDFLWSSRFLVIRSPAIWH
jgi:lysylphosphatidylglycerol synthetase-like protein (DUF2156 family)